MLFTWKAHCGLKFRFGQFDRSEICTEVSFTAPEVIWTLIMKLPDTEVKFYPEVKSQTGLSLLQISWKRTPRHRLHDTWCELKPVWNLKRFWKVVLLTWQFRARLHETRSEHKPVWNLKPLWNVVPFTWQFTWRFHCGNFPNNSKALLHMCKWYFLINVNLINAKNCYQWKLLIDASLEHVYMRPEENSNRFEISLWDKTSLRCELTSLSAFTWLRAEWNSLRCKFHFGQNDRREISNCSEFSM